MQIMFQRYGGAAVWLGFFAFVLTAWGLLFAMQPNALEAELSALYGDGFWAALCAPLTAQSTLVPIFLMWALMSGAMMAPTFVPTLKTYRDLGHTEAANGLGMLMLLAGYLAIWIGFSLVAAAAQLVLARAGLIGASGASISWGLSAVLLAGAGIYQFSTVKDACLSKCRAPLMFFMGRWKPGLGGAFYMGVELGVVCLGCCWALMTLGFVGGVMNLLWMGIATSLMVLEKLPQIGRVITRPLGIILLAAAVFASLQAFGI